MNDGQRQLLSVGQCATLACTLEVLAPKPGNVHRRADFQNTSFQDFLVSAVVVGSVLDQGATKRIGELVLESVQATQHWVAGNTNLGLILLLAPLAKAASTAPDKLTVQGVRLALNSLDAVDSRDVYTAIAIARPGGLGSSARWDVASEQPPQCLLAAMKHAADRDLVARQYFSGFEQVFGDVLSHLTGALAAGLGITDAIVDAHVRLMATYPDSLIARKNGNEVAAEASSRAAEVLTHPAGSPKYAQALAELDAWLRADGNKRNPGTTADLIGAGLFVALRNDMITMPLR